MSMNFTPLKLNSNNNNNNISSLNKNEPNQNADYISNTSPNEETFSDNNLKNFNFYSTLSNTSGIKQNIFNNNNKYL
jgi:hypothetical protein